MLFDQFFGPFWPVLAHFVDPRIFPKIWYKNYHNLRTVHDLRPVEPILETRRKGGENNVKNYDFQANGKNRLIYGVSPLTLFWPGFLRDVKSRGGAPGAPPS